ncbi:hypothetical protein ABTU92_21850 [Rhodoplanes sp. SY1]
MRSRRRSTAPTWWTRRSTVPVGSGEVERIIRETRPAAEFIVA